MWPQRVQYALRALIALAIRPSERISAGEIARRYDIPPKYLEAILLDLRHAGFVDSTKGKTGGYQLAKEPSALRLITIIQVLEPSWFAGPPGGSTGAGGSSVGVAAPSTGRPLPEQPLLTTINDTVRDKLTDLTLADALSFWQSASDVLNYVI